MMDLLGDFLLFGLGPEQGPLLFGASSVQVAQDSGGGGWWQVGGQSRRSHAPVTRDIPKPSQDRTPSKPITTPAADIIRPDIIIPDEVTRLLDPVVPRESSPVSDTTTEIVAPQNDLWDQSATPKPINENRARDEEAARESQRDDEAERKRSETKARRDQRHQRQRQQRQLSRAHRMVERQRRAGERERKAEQAAEDEAILVLMMVALAT
jgi:hypothetical protein